MKEGAKSVRQNPWIINPKLKPLVKLEIKKMEKARIIFLIRHSKWITNLIIVRKKNEEIRLY